MYIQLGFLISIGGAATQDGYFALKKAIPLLGLPQIVVETDSPDQLPKLNEVGALQINNEPQFLLGIAKTIAQLKGLEESGADSVLDQSTENLKKLFGI